MDILEKLFCGPARARMMRLFVYNPDSSYDAKTLAKKTGSRLPLVKKELKLLSKIHLVKKKPKGFAVNPNFKYLEALREFLLRVSPMTEDAIAKKLSDKGNAKLVVVSGLFINKNDSRADMLVVSDRSHEKKVQKAIEGISAEFGREISYALFTKDDFSYRMGMGDKLLRDIFDFPHRVILDKIGFEK